MRTALVALLSLAFIPSVLAKGIELRPDVSPRGTLQFGFRCQYDSEDSLNFVWLVKTSQRLQKVPTSLWWSAYDTRTQRYYLPWTHFEPSAQAGSPQTTWMIAAQDPKISRPVLRNLMTTELHFSVDGSGDSRSVAYVFPLGQYRVQEAGYFYDLTDPIQHCKVNEFDLPY